MATPGDIKESFLITGGTGFLGSNIVRRLAAGGQDIIVLKRSNSKIDRIKGLSNNLKFYDMDGILLEQVFRENHINRIIHCATNYGRSLTNPLEILEANLMLPLKLLELGKKYKIDCFINTDTILDKRINFYTLSKSQFKQWLEIYASDFVCINIELEHFYGPFDDDSKFVTNVVHKLLSDVREIDLTAGKQKRSFIYIDDVVDAFVKIIDFSRSLVKDFHNFQVGAEEAIEIREFVETAKKVTGNTKTILNFGQLPYRENEVMEIHLDLSKLKELGWQPKVFLKEGLQKMTAMERGVQQK